MKSVKLCFCGDQCLDGPCISVESSFTDTNERESQSYNHLYDLSSFVDPGFWSELTRLKLEEYQLDESPKHLTSYYCNSDAPGTPCRLSIDFNALSPTPSVPNNSLSLTGTLLLTNTREGFKEMDRNRLLQCSGKEDIKQYRYYYWAAFPSICIPEGLKESRASVCVGESGRLSAEQVSSLPSLVGTYRKSPEGVGQIAFLLSIYGPSASDLTIHPFASAKTADFSKTLVCVVDPSTNPQYAGWPARNTLAALAFHRPDVKRVDVLCWRCRYSGGVLEMGGSVVVGVEWGGGGVGAGEVKTVGWERNVDGVLGPRMMDMSCSMDPVKLAEGAVDLNLQLMRWRQVENIDLESMKNLRCLLFGAGTLGCNVARALLAWGVRNMTLVDNGKVSYSNPVRQSLFRFRDSLEGRAKAEAAEKSLLEIFPSANVKGLQITVPMPGHIVPPKEESEVKSTVEKIVELVESHDAIFLLMDTREGRWLPTLLSTAHSKLCMSVALGFDSYVVIRHGCGLPSSPDPLPAGGSIPSLIPGDQLGCYFCTDVSVPGNSLKDRTLDQQCTVTRPGVSMMAGGLAVECVASIVQHPLKALAPAVIPSDNEQGSFGGDGEGVGESCLGVVPHQIRGFLSRFHQMTPCVRRFQHCIACSPLVVGEWERRRWEFLLDAFNSPNTLEKVAGLTEMKEAAEKMEVFELSDSESIQSSCD